MIKTKTVHSQELGHLDSKLTADKENLRVDL